MQALHGRYPVADAAGRRAADAVVVATCGFDARCGKTRWGLADGPPPALPCLASRMGASCRSPDLAHAHHMPSACCSGCTISGAHVAARRTSTDAKAALHDDATVTSGMKNDVENPKDAMDKSAPTQRTWPPCRPVLMWGLSPKHAGAAAPLGRPAKGKANM